MREKDRERDQCNINKIKREEKTQIDNHDKKGQTGKKRSIQR